MSTRVSRGDFGDRIEFGALSEGRAIERAQSEVRYQYDKAIKPTSVLLVTWVHMQPMGEQNLSEEVRLLCLASSLISYLLSLTILELEHLPSGHN